MSQTLDQNFKWTKSSVPRNRLTNAYEPIQPYLLAELSKYLGCSIFVDIGANIGFYSVIMASELDEPTLYAFEPMAPTYSELKHNISLNGLSDETTLFKLALSSKSGEAEMSVLGPLSGANAIRDTSIHKDNRSVKTEKVSISTLDDEMPVSGQTVSLKIDVERHEAEVLDGGRRFFKENACIIQFESLSSDAHYPECLEILTSLGYRELISVGSDQYFSNINFSERELISCISKTLTRFVAASKRPGTSGKDSPVKRRILPGISIEFSLRFSALLRKFMKKNLS